MQITLVLIANNKHRFDNVVNLLRSLISLLSISFPFIYYFGSPGKESNWKCQCTIKATWS